MEHRIQKYNINQRCAYMIHAVSVTKYQNYTSILILKHANVLAEVIKSHGVWMYKIMTYKKCTALKYTYAQWPY